jgi:heme exporter protein C
MKKKVFSIFTGFLTVCAFVAMFVNLYLIFFFAPEEATMGHAQRIFYFHLPCNIMSFLAYFIVFVCSILYLMKKDRKYDVVAHASAEIGLLFNTLGLITGSIWGRAAWNVWWVWSPRLTLFLVLWFLFIAYMMLRTYIDGEERRARFASVFGIFAFMDVPMVYLSTKIWSDIHPGSVMTSGGLEPDMRVTILFSLLTFTLLFVLMLMQRIRLQKSVVAVSDIRRNVEMNQ